MGRLVTLTVIYTLEDEAPEDRVNAHEEMSGWLTGALSVADVLDSGGRAYIDVGGETASAKALETTEEEDE